MSDTPQRITRSMSHHPSSDPLITGTAPGPPISGRDSSLHSNTAHPSNPYQVDLVIPFDISNKGDRNLSQQDVRDGYELLLRSLEGEGGLRVASRLGRGGKGKEEVWVFVGITNGKVEQLSERERSVPSVKDTRVLELMRQRILDRSHNLPSHSLQTPTSPSTRLRYLYSLLTSPPLQKGLGITPGEGNGNE